MTLQAMEKNSLFTHRAAATGRFYRVTSTRARPPWSNNRIPTAASMTPTLASYSSWPTTIVG